jgi:hypothetical protein
MVDGLSEVANRPGNVTLFCFREDKRKRTGTGSAPIACVGDCGEKISVGSARAGEFVQHRMSCERDLGGVGAG